MSRAAFAQHLQSATDAIIEKWREAVCRHPDIPTARRLARPELTDHLPALLDRVGQGITGQETPEVEPEGRAHGHERRQLGYDIAEVMREHTVLRQILLAEVDAFAGRSPGLTPEEREAVRHLFIDVLDRSAQAAAEEYHTEAIAERQGLEAALALTNRELEAANGQKDRFLAMLSHELRNPLAPILTAVQFLAASDPADPRAGRAREIIERQVRHLARLIDDLLDISRITSGKISLRREVHNLKLDAAHAAEVCLPLFEAKKQVLSVELPDGPLPVDADPDRMEQAITNLLTNANRYTPAGGRIWLTAEREGEEAVVRVRDTGVGIAPELLPQVFDLFTQADSSQNCAEGGLGLGLAIVKRLVDLHGGTVEVQSDGSGQGSEFILRLPVAAESSLAEVTGPPAAADQAGACGILLVEDNEDARESTAALLEIMGHHVTAAPDGPTALQLAPEARPDVCIVDIGLPGMNGYEVARQLRRLRAGKHALLIAVTGYGSPEEQREARQAGFDAHLTKPAEIDALQALLARRAGG